MDSQKTIHIKQERTFCAPDEQGLTSYGALAIGHQQTTQVKEEETNCAPDEPGLMDCVKCEIEMTTTQLLVPFQLKEEPQFVRPVYKLMHETNLDINLDARLAKNLIGYHNAAPAEGPETFLVQKGPEVMAITVIDPNAPVDCVKCQYFQMTLHILQCCLLIQRHEH